MKAQLPLSVRMLVKRLYIRRCQDCGRWTVRFCRGYLCIVRCRRCEREEPRTWRRVQEAEDKIERYPF